MCCKQLPTCAHKECIWCTVLLSMLWHEFSKYRLSASKRLSLRIQQKADTPGKSSSELPSCESRQIHTNSSQQMIANFVVVQLVSHVRFFVTPCTTGSCPSPSPGACLNASPLNRWCHPTISSSVTPFSSCPQAFLASGSFKMSQFFISGGQSIGASASASVLPTNTQSWSPLGWTGLISLQSKGLSKLKASAQQRKI